MHTHIQTYVRTYHMYLQVATWLFSKTRRDRACRPSPVALLGERGLLSLLYFTSTPTPTPTSAAAMTSAIVFGYVFGWWLPLRASFSFLTFFSLLYASWVIFACVRVCVCLAGLYFEWNFAQWAALTQDHWQRALTWISCFATVISLTCSLSLSLPVWLSPSHTPTTCRLWVAQYSRLEYYTQRIHFHFWTEQVQALGLQLLHFHS